LHCPKPSTPKTRNVIFPRSVPKLCILLRSDRLSDVVRFPHLMKSTGGTCPPTRTSLQRRRAPASIFLKRVGAAVFCKDWGRLNCSRHSGSFSCFMVPTFENIRAYCNSDLSSACLDESARRLHSLRHRVAHRALCLGGSLSPLRRGVMIPHAQKTKVVSNAAQAVARPIG
jgi:hypothetical protein